MPKGIMLTPEQQEERREEIISVALQLIEKNGFQKTSMREIAILANMGKSSLYDFFKTKDEIVAVSYTHLDVYKRQAVCIIWKIIFP